MISVHIPGREWSKASTPVSTAHSSDIQDRTICVRDLLPDGIGEFVRQESMMP
jgi:hypothetical protein